MPFKKIIKWMFKAAVACVIALAVATGCCYLYYNIPVHHSNPTGETDYKWTENFTYFQCLEGFSTGKVNNDGFNNLENPDSKKINILFMGSSHGEAFNVNQKKNCVSRLNEMFDGDKYVYNIATSGHTLSQLCRNLNDALNTYKPTDYVILECQSVTPQAKNMLKAVDGSLPRLESAEGFFVDVTQKIPYFRLLYSQLTNIKAANSQNQENENNNAENVSDKEYREALNLLLNKIKTDSESHGVKPIIIYHPHVSLQKDGSLEFLHYTEDVERFYDVCSEVGITFIDMSDDIVKGYQTEHKLPHGFSNTALGEGHLNSYGHQLLAERLYNVIEQTEAGK